METYDERVKQYYKADLNRKGKIETEDIVVCPYCYTQRDLYGHEFDNNEWEDEEECEICGNPYKIEAEVRYQFWAKTRRVEK